VASNPFWSKFGYEDVLHANTTDDTTTVVSSMCCDLLSVLEESEDSDDDDAAPVPANTRKLPQVQHHLLLGLSICIRHGYTQPMEKIIIKCVCPSRHLSPTSVLTPLSRLQVRSAAEGAGHDLAEPGDRDGGGAAGELQGGLREGGAAERGLVRHFARAKRAQKRA
jgi:hypothetical protein